MGGSEGKNVEEDKCEKEGQKRKGWWLKEENQIRKVHWAQWGLGPRLRGSRCMVSAMARFWAQRTIPHYTFKALNKVANCKVPLSSLFKSRQKVWLEAKNLALPYGLVKLAPQQQGLFVIT
jgi:hypothetical protein